MQYIEITMNEQHGCPQSVLGHWKSIGTGLDSVEDLHAYYQQNPVTSLYEFIGGELHAAQQNQTKLSYKGSPVCAERMEDTGGGEVSASTVLLVATVRLPVMLLDDNYEVTVE